MSWIFGGLWNFILEFTILNVAAILAFPIFLIFIIGEIKKSGERKPFRYIPLSEDEFFDWEDFFNNNNST
ncbi:unnamed protein product [marine sediment metagenome]|uniref:Uncharacterized protein n=1 Tax=marine sediment metagenome TaxID=412755 RepID=X1M0W5_9ZZZZ